MNPALLLAAALLLMVVLTASAAPADSPGARGVDAEEGFFPIMPWGAIPVEDIAGVADCHFTVAGFVQPSALPECEKHGLKAIVHNPPDPDREPWKAKWRGVTDEAIDAAIRKVIEQAGDSPAILGYYINDEPGTPAFSGLARAVAGVKKWAPGKLAYINLFPGYATLGAPDTSQLGAASFPEYLDRFATEVRPQMLSYDDYQVMYSDDFADSARAAVYFSDLLLTREAAVRHRLPFWNTVASNQIRPFTVIPSPANLALQAFATLAAGGRGIAWYTYRRGGYNYAPVENDGRRTDTWQYLRVVNGQVKVLGPTMNRLASTGVYFTDPAPVPIAHLLPGKLVTEVESRASVKGIISEKPPVMVGEFACDDGSDYVMIVNLSLQRSTNVMLRLAKEYELKQVIASQDGSLQPLDEENGHWLLPGNGALIRLTPKQ